MRPLLTWNGMPALAYPRRTRRVTRGGGPMLQLRDLRARITRLEALTRGLALEAALLKEGNDPLLYRERRLYLKGIHDALAGVETARAALAGAVRRMEGL